MTPEQRAALEYLFLAWDTHALTTHDQTGNEQAGEIDRAFEVLREMVAPKTLPEQYGLPVGARILSISPATGTITYEEP